MLEEFAYVCTDWDLQFFDEAWNRVHGLKLYIVRKLRNDIHETV